MIDHMFILTVMFGPTAGRGRQDAAPQSSYGMWVRFEHIIDSTNNLTHDAESIPGGHTQAALDALNMELECRTG